MQEFCGLHRSPNIARIMRPWVTQRFGYISVVDRLAVHIESQHVNSLQYIGFEALIAVIITSRTFWHIKPCSPLKVNRRFGGQFCLQEA
jgi:hypothetical protein